MDTGNKSIRTLKYADELIKTDSKQIVSGFNMFINGNSEPKSSEYGDKEEWYLKLQGYQFAQKMAKENGIAFVHIFKCGQSSNCFPFEYGGFFVCNACGNKGVDRDWWKIQVEKDSNSYCCHGLDFVDLQSSSNYAFGDTFEDAISNYGKLMINQ